MRVISRLGAWRREKHSKMEGGREGGREGEKERKRGREGGRERGRSHCAGVIIVSGPFGENQENKPAKQTHQEQDLRNELCQNTDVAPGSPAAENTSCT